MANYYNEIDPYAAEWLCNLIVAGHLPKGDVDERSIEDVKPEDLEGYAQCHFFAGIGGWPLALRLAGWPEDRRVWTGSCPCQPLSSAGQRKGHADRRHLWPAFQHLIAECAPATIFGEQVASKDGREWFCGVRADLEHMGYAYGGVDMPAASVGAPHIRQRLWWVAHAEGTRTGQDERRLRQERWDGGENGGLEYSSRKRFNNATEERAKDVSARICSTSGSGTSVWATRELIPCADGKARRVEPGVLPLAHGVPARVGRLRAYGNAIVPQVASQFVRAYLEC